MSVEHGVAARGDLAQAILDAIDVGTAGNINVRAGTQASPGAVVCEIALPTTSFSRSGAVLTLLGVPLSANALTVGPIGMVEIRDSANVVIFTGEAGLTGSGAVAEFITLTTIIGQPVTITAGSYTASV